MERQCTATRFIRVHLHKLRAMMNAWTKQRDLLIEEAFAFAQAVAANSPKLAAMPLRQFQLAQNSDLQCNVTSAPHGHSVTCGSFAAFLLCRRIEAAVTLPRIGIVRVAGADRDRADAHVTVVVPAFLAGIEDRRRLAACATSLPHPYKPEFTMHEHCDGVSGPRPCASRTASS